MGGIAGGSLVEVVASQAQVWEVWEVLQEVPWWMYFLVSKDRCVTACVQLAGMG